MATTTEVYKCPKCGSSHDLFVVQATVIGRMRLEPDGSGFEISGSTEDEVVYCDTCNFRGSLGEFYNEEKERPKTPMMAPVEVPDVEQALTRRSKCKDCKKPILRKRPRVIIVDQQWGDKSFLCEDCGASHLNTIRGGLEAFITELNEIYPKGSVTSHSSLREPLLGYDIELDKSGRAKCGTCGKKLRIGSKRFVVKNFKRAWIQHTYFCKACALKRLNRELHHVLEQMDDLDALATRLTPMLAPASVSPRTKYVVDEFREALIDRRREVKTGKGSPSRSDLGVLTEVKYLIEAIDKAEKETADQNYTKSDILEAGFLSGRFSDWCNEQIKLIEDYMAKAEAYQERMGYLPRPDDYWVARRGTLLDFRRLFVSILSGKFKEIDILRPKTPMLAPSDFDVRLSDPDVQAYIENVVDTYFEVFNRPRETPEEHRAYSIWILGSEKERERLQKTALIKFGEGLYGEFDAYLRDVIEFRINRRRAQSRTEKGPGTTSFRIPQTPMLAPVFQTFLEPTIGYTDSSKEFIEKHIGEIGRVDQVVLKVQPSHKQVVIMGELGEIIVNGFEWGYSGQGPRGLVWLLEEVLAWKLPKDSNVLTLDREAGHVFTKKPQTPMLAPQKGRWWEEGGGKVKIFCPTCGKDAWVRNSWRTFTCYQCYTLIERDTYRPPLHEKISRNPLDFVDNRI